MRSYLLAGRVEAFLARSTHGVQQNGSAGRQEQLLDLTEIGLL